MKSANMYWNPATGQEEVQRGSDGYPSVRADCSFVDGPVNDAFGRLRTSHPVTLFASTQEYDTDPLHMENYVAGGGTAVYTQANSSTVLSTDAATSNNRALRQSKVYWRYQPGKSQIIKLTGTLAKSGTPAGAAVARIGYYDDNNGIYFGRDSTGYFIAIRSNVSGSIVEAEKVYQSAWSEDSFGVEGKNPSGVTIDFTKEQIFFIDLQWLGVGRVRGGFVVDGKLSYAHLFEHANLTTQVYMKTANLPVRYEVFNSGAAGSNISLEAICCAVESEGGAEDVGGVTLEFDNSNSVATAANSATLTPLCTIRLKDTFNGITYRGQAHHMVVSFLADKNTYYELIWNATTLTSAAGAVNELTAGTWIDLNTTYSGIEYNVAATAYTGGLAMGSGFIAASGSGSNSVGAEISGVPSRLILARTYANVRDTITIAARGLGAASAIYFTVNIEEQH
ncbi:hypothetical protein UFOVP1590_19 [uncultured Caudovirales phage]|uniref:Uncharacterized protein n=1 Tax=uncultured Caudovirales phage TaxID=2100421 RepID=A0A6J5SNW8_9CAUD|nr:hypothetical protein UFOVP1590_19 [uncultured Caudovirales phage]